ncbi:IS4 family transposase [Dysgonomonas reticulitermitis]
MIFTKILNEINSSHLQERFKMNKKDFTRKRKQTFKGTILFLINILRKSLCIEIVNFVHYLRKIEGVEYLPFSKSAFVQYRKKISPEVFRHLSALLINEFYDNNSEVKQFNGFRLLAVDTSVINLPKNTGLEVIYGKSQKQAGDYLVQARVSVFYDVLNKLAIDSSIAPLHTGERQMAVTHLEAATGNDLILYDRGYPSYDLIYEHQIRSINFLMRVQVNFNHEVKSFVSSGAMNQEVEIYPGRDTDFSIKSYVRQTPLKVRLIALELPCGQKEYLITSLLDSIQYPMDIFKELYFQRWQIETCFDELKNKLNMESFSGYSNQTILQDFNATIFVSNIQSIIVNELEVEIHQKSSCTKYRYKVNNSLSYGFLKNRIISLFFFEEKKIEEIILELKNLFKNHMIPIRPNRSNMRNKFRYKKRVRPKVSKNQRDAI